MHRSESAKNYSRRCFNVLQISVTYYYHDRGNNNIVMTTAVFLKPKHMVSNMRTKYYHY